MADYKVISSDSHVVEPPDIWVERMDRAKFGNRIPHMVPAGDIDAWMVDNKETGGVGSIAQAGFRFDRPDEIVLKGSFDDVRPGGYIPSEHVKDMDIDGVYGGLSRRGGPGSCAGDLCRLQRLAGRVLQRLPGQAEGRGNDIGGRGR